MELVLFDRGDAGLPVGVLAALVIDLGGVLRCEAMDGGDREVDQLWNEGILAFSSPVNADCEYAHAQAKK